MPILHALLRSAAAAALFAPPAPVHPLHTTLTELTYVAASRTVEVSIRVFADDFGAAAGHHAGVKPAPDNSVPETAASAYIGATFALVAPDGRPLPLAWCGGRRTGDVLWLCLRGAAPRELAGARVLAGMLFDLHDDQVNIVQVSDGARRQTLLFTKGDGEKPLKAPR